MQNTVHFNSMNSDSEKHCTAFALYNRMYILERYIYIYIYIVASYIVDMHMYGWLVSNVL